MLIKSFVTTTPSIYIGYKSCAKISVGDLRNPWNILRVLFYVFCLIIFMRLHILYLYFFNFHSPTLGRSIYVKDGP